MPRVPSGPPAAEFEVKYLTVNPEQTYAGQPVTITSNVCNTGGSTGQYTVTLMINGQVEQTRLVSVGAGVAQPVRFTVTRSQPGTYTVAIGGDRATFTVTGAASGTSGSSATGGLMAIMITVILVLGAVVALMIALRRRAA